jgi:hypothetical protein
VGNSYPEISFSVPLNPIEKGSGIVRMQANTPGRSGSPQLADLVGAVYGKITAIED